MAIGKFTKPNIKLTLFFLLLLGYTSYRFYFWDKTAHIKEPFNLYSLENGDLIFRRQSGFISELARNLSITDKRFSHVGIVVINDQIVSVIHAVSDDKKQFNGVVRERLDGFLAEAEDWGVFRARASESTRRQIARDAEEYQQLNLPFDDDFSLETTDRFYCTEFVWRIFQPRFPDSLAFPTGNIAGKLFVPLDQLYLNPLFTALPIR